MLTLFSPTALSSLLAHLPQRLTRLVKLSRDSQHGRSMRVWKDKRLVQRACVRFLNGMGGVCRNSHLQRSCQRLQSTGQSVMSRRSGALFSLAFHVFVVCHICSCLWAYTNFSANSLPEQGWIIGRDVCVSFADCGDQKLWLYLLSMYWSFTTLTTVGYGDIGPSSSGRATQVGVLEVLCSIVVQACGALIFASVVGEISSAMTARNNKEEKIMNKMNALIDYMASGSKPGSFRDEISFATQSSIVRYIGDGTWAVGSDDEEDLLEALPASLRTKLINEGYRRLREGAGRIPLLAKIDRTAFAMLFAQLGGAVRFESFPSGSTIVKRGEEGDSCYIVLGGIVSLRYVDPGEFIGVKAAGPVVDLRAAPSFDGLSDGANEDDNADEGNGGVRCNGRCCGMAAQWEDSRFEQRLAHFQSFMNEFHDLTIDAEANNETDGTASGDGDDGDVHIDRKDSMFSRTPRTLTPRDAEKLKKGLAPATRGGRLNEQGARASVPTPPPSEQEELAPNQVTLLMRGASFAEYNVLFEGSEEGRVYQHPYTAIALLPTQCICIKKKAFDNVRTISFRCVDGESPPRLTLPIPLSRHHTGRLAPLAPPRARDDAQHSCGAQRGACSPRGGCIHPSPRSPVA